jgi:Xaa-Pro aminopeptidase
LSFPVQIPHHSEYVCDHWKGREWISGFNGSAGTAVVTMTSAALWTDSRYFLAAAEQLEGTEYQLMKMKMPGTPSITQWLVKELDDIQSPEVGMDGMVNSNAFVESMAKELRETAGITVRTNFDPLRFIWKNRPVIPLNKVELQPLEYAGEPTQSKLSRIRQALRENHADGILVAALDDIAWTLNLRGTDVHCNPVFVAYLLISSDAVTLYINNVKLTPEVSAYLEKEHITVDDYENVRQGLRDYFEYNIQLDPNEINYTLFHTPTREVVRAQSPIPEMKSHKNETEIRGFRNAMLRDGIAMVKFLNG